MPTDPLGFVDQTLLGRYYVEAPIAQGGMGAVYRGSDLRLRRPVCIKIFHWLRGDDVLYRASYDHFVQEAYALSRLSHPNTLRIYDFGHLMDDSLAPFQVSEFMNGGTLGQWIRHEGLRSPTETLSLIAPIAGALSEAHTRGIIHRDVKPSNIMLGVLGARRIAKLGDFGIAQTGDEAVAARPREAPRSSMRLYSLGWAAPEQLHGERTTPATDVFALGLVTAFTLAGRPVFSTKGDRPDAGERVQSDAHVARWLEQTGLVAELADVIRRACLANPAQRYASMEQFAAALEDAVGLVTRRSGSDCIVANVPEVWDEPKSCLTLSPLFLPVDDAVPPAATEPAALRLPARPLPTSGPVRARDRGRRDSSLLVDCGVDREVTVLGRRLTFASTLDSRQLDLGGAGHRVPSKARFRVTFLPSRAAGARVHIKGLNCFVARVEARPAAAVTVDENTVLELVAEDRKLLDRLVCSIGQPSGLQQLCRFGPLTLCITGAPAGAALLDLGPGRELVLIHSGMPALLQGGHP